MNKLETQTKNHKHNRNFINLLSEVSSLQSEKMLQSIRTFIAIEISDEIRSEIASHIKKLQDLPCHISWVKPENLHLTLKFLGNVTEPQLQQLSKSLKEKLSVFHAFPIETQVMGSFPENKSPRILWAGLKNGTALSEIARIVENEAEMIGVPKENRPFAAHITVGRVKSSKNSNLLLNALNETKIKPIQQMIYDITLFKSTLLPNGPVYEPMIKFPLQQKI